MQVDVQISIEKIDSYFDHQVKLSITDLRDHEFIVSETEACHFKKYMHKWGL